MDNSASGKNDKWILAGGLVILGTFIADCKRMQEPRYQDEKIIPVASGIMDLGKFGVTTIKSAWTDGHKTWKERESKREEERDFSHPFNLFD